MTYNVLYDFNATSRSTTLSNPNKESDDFLVSMWIYAKISPTLVDLVLDSSATGNRIWELLKDGFHDNKDARIIQIDNEIHNINIDILTVTDYFQEIKHKAVCQANLGVKVSDSSLVAYATKWSSSSVFLRLHISFDMGRNIPHLIRFDP
nr:Toll/interleukin-1 receptor (TIR) domain-containing protein [Tanacetum cinerariifolium]